MSSFTDGVLVTAAAMVRLHDEPSLAADVLIDLGYQTAPCLHLPEYDKIYLRTIQNACGGRVRLRGLNTMYLSDKDE